MALALTFGLSLSASARYRPANFDSLPELPVTSTDVPYVTLEQSDYKVTGSTHVLTEGGSGQAYGALRFGNVNKVTIWMEANTSIKATGRSSDGSYGGGAGIYLPSGKTLIFRCVDDASSGVARVIAQGGAGSDSKNGDSGEQGKGSSYGAGGNGGRGAHAGGAGIGGYGGKGGAGGDRTVGSTSAKDASPGGDGESGGSGAGTLWCYDGVEIQATAGANGALGYSAAANGGSNTEGQSGGGGGGGGGGGSSGFTPAIGGGGSGGGGGGGGGGAHFGGGCGGGGGAANGLGGKGGQGGDIGGYDWGGGGSNGGSESGGSGGTPCGKASTGGDGGKGGSISTGASGGIVRCADTAAIVRSGSTNSAKADGKASSVTAALVSLDFGGKTVINEPDTCVLSAADGTVYDSPVAVPAAEGWKFLGYWTSESSTKMAISPEGKVDTSVVLDSANLYARWEMIPAQPTGSELTKLTEDGYILTLNVTNAPARQDTFGYWYLCPTNDPDNASSWYPFTPEGYVMQNLQQGDTIEVSVSVLPNKTPSGDYYFRCDLVTERWGNGDTLTNRSNRILVTYIRRDTPEYDAETKTLWANGSALKIIRDTRDASRTVVYWDRAWDGVYEGAFSRGLGLSGVDWWVNGGFRDGAQVGGGVKIDFVSGEVFGLNAGDNLAPSIKGSTEKVRLDKGSDAVVGHGGEKNWPK